MARIIRDDLIDPPDPRHHVPGTNTEIEAARLATKYASANHLTVLRVLAKEGPLTDDEGAEITGLYRYTFGPRRNDLMKVGYVVDTGERRRTPRGAQASVYAITDTGRAYLRSRS